MPEDTEETLHGTEPFHARLPKRIKTQLAEAVETLADRGLFVSMTAVVSMLVVRYLPELVDSFVNTPVRQVSRPTVETEELVAVVLREVRKDQIGRAEVLAAELLAKQREARARAKGTGERP